MNDNMKNRGLVAHKNRLNRNPRVKKREQYRKALVAKTRFSFQSLLSQVWSSIMRKNGEASPIFMFCNFIPDPRCPQRKAQVAARR